MQLSYFNSISKPQIFLILVATYNGKEQIDQLYKCVHNINKTGRYSWIVTSSD